TDTGNHACSGRLAIVSIVGDQQPDFEKHRTADEQPGEPRAAGQLAAAMLLVDLLGTAALPQFLFERLQIFDELAHRASADGGHDSRIQYARGLAVTGKG